MENLSNTRDMKTVAIIAPTGMLGSAVYAQLKDYYKLVLVLRDPKKLEELDRHYGGVSTHQSVVIDSDAIYQDYLHGFYTAVVSSSVKKLLDAIGPVDAVINCAGITNRYSAQKPLEAMFINGALPHIFSYHYGSKLIHITTDCVYDGIKGAPYDETSPPNPTDIYGISKLLGEPKDHSLVFRTSIIGPEISGFVSLLEWVKQQEGKTIKGFTNHLWNGITTKEFGNICDKIISNRDAFPKSGLFHIFSNDVTKYEMVMKIKEKFGVNVNIGPEESSPIDRRLGSIHDLCKKLKIPSFVEMVQQL